MACGVAFAHGGRMTKENAICDDGCVRLFGVHLLLDFGLQEARFIDVSNRVTAAVLHLQLQSKLLEVYS